MAGSGCSRRTGRFAAVLLMLALADARPVTFGVPVAAQETTPVYEIRTYTANPGRYADMLETFRSYWTKTIFPRHGLRSLVYLLPSDPPLAGQKMVYVLEHRSRDAAEKSWAAFMADPEVAAISKRRNANGRIVASFERIFATAADFSPLDSAQNEPAPARGVPCRSASGEVAAVCSVNAKWDEANLKMDPLLVEPILDEHFFWVAGPNLPLKKDIVEILETTTVRFDQYESANVTVYLTPQMAHAVGLSKRKVRVGLPDHSGEWRFTRTFVKRAGEWKILSHHYTKLSPAQ